MNARVHMIGLAVLLAALTTLGTWLAGAHTPAPAGHEIQVHASPIPLDPLHPEETRAGALTYVGGLVLTSGDKEFGGFSGLEVSPDGQHLTAVSDRGNWMTARINYDGEAPTGLTDVRLAPIADQKKMPVSGEWSDAEGLAVTTSGRMLVSFERRHRIWSYDLTRDGLDALPKPVALPPVVKTIRNNKGIEGIVTLDDGRLLALTEQTFDIRDRLMGWVETKKGFEVLYIQPAGIFHITDLARLPGGDILMLERRYTVIGGPGMQLRRIAKADVRPGAMLDGPVLVELSSRYNIDNMEGLAVRPDPAGGAFIYIISDDNFSDIQRTLLLLFKIS